MSSSQNAAYFVLFFCYYFFFNFFLQVLSLSRLLEARRGAAESYWEEVSWQADRNIAYRRIEKHLSHYYQEARLWRGDGGWVRPARRSALFQGAET